MAMDVLAVLVAMGLPENAQNSASVSVRSYYMSAILKMRKIVATNVNGKWLLLKIES